MSGGAVRRNGSEEGEYVERRVEAGGSLSPNSDSVTWLSEGMTWPKRAEGVLDIDQNDVKRAGFKKATQGQVKHRF